MKNALCMHIIINNVDVSKCYVNYVQIFHRREQSPLNLGLEWG